MTTEHLHSPSSSSNSPNAFSSRSTGAPPALMSGVVPPFMGGGGGGASAQVNLPKPNEEVWVENKTSDNRVYYYNARTRESSWTKPAAGPNVRIITQDEVERMAAVNNQLQQATGNSGTANKQAGAAATGDQNASKSTNNDAADANDASKDQHVNGNKPAAQVVQSSAESKVADAKPTNPVHAVPPGPVAPMIPPPFAFQGGPMPPFPFMPGAPGAPPVGAPPAGFPPFMPPPGMFPPGGFPGPFPGMPPPPFGAPFGMPPFGVPPFAVPPFAAHPLDEGKYYYTEETKREMKEVEEKMVKAREESAYYTEHDTPDGKKYYYNSKLNQSFWEKPKCLTELTELEARFEELKKKRIEKPVEQASSGKGQSAKDAKDKENELSEEEKAKQKSKPVSSTAVPGTPWCVVWTRDRRVFFYNPSEKVSLWERPPILMGRPDVDKLVKECPVKDTGDSQTTISSTPSAVSAAAAAAAAAVSAGKKKSGETTAAEPPVKKNKVSVDDDENSRGSASPKSDAANSPRGDRSMSPFSTPTKPQVVPDEFLQKDKIEASKEAALEAEHKAAQVRAQLPLEQRIQQFKDLLVEKDVSAYSTWEKELQKIVFDPRYLLLTSKERKSVFEKYVRDRANQESKEKSAALKKKKDDFRELLKEANVSTKNSMSFTEFSAKYGRDERFKAIDKLKDRELMFNDYLSDLRRQEKEEKQQSDKEARKKNFYSMLKELKHLYKHSSWTETKKLIENDARYKAIESSSKREDYFRDYCKGLDDKPSSAHNGDSSKSRDKHEKSSDKHEKHKSSDDRDKRRSSKEREKDKDRERDKERDKDKDKEKEKDKDKDRERERERDRDRDRERDKDKEKDRDREREREKDRDKERDKDKDKENKKDAESSRMDHDGEPVEKEKKKRHKTTTASQESNNGREEGETNDDDDDDEEMPEHDDHKNNHRHHHNNDDNDDDHDNTHNGLSDEEKRKEREKQERIEASLRERNKEVKEQLSKYQDERDKGREKLKKDEIVECFRALLIDLIKTNVSTGGGDSSSSSSSKPSELSWKEAKKILKRDSRWSYCKPLEKDEKESLFDEHIKKFRAKKRDIFYQLLDESSSSINLKTSTWKEVKKLIKSDPRYEKLQTGGDSFKMEKEFDTYLAERLAKAKLDFKELLMQTKLITHNTFTKLKEQPNHAKELEDLLANDKSYLVLDCVPDERKKILLDYVEQLHKDGPPPPPTATEPSKIRNKT